MKGVSGESKERRVERKEKEELQEKEREKERGEGEIAHRGRQDRLNSG